MLYGGVVKASTSRLILLDAITINIAASNRSMLRGVELLKQATAREVSIPFSSLVVSRQNQKLSDRFVNSYLGQIRID